MKRKYYETIPNYNDRIHKENPYFNKPPDFLELSRKYPVLNNYIYKKQDGSVGYKFFEKSATKYFYFIMTIWILLIYVGS